MLLISPEKIKEYENQADAAGFSFDHMMRIAGTSLADLIHKRWHDFQDKKITGMVGGGKNGADTLIALTKLNSLGWSTHAVKVSSSRLIEWVIQEYEHSGGILEEYQDSRHFAEIIKDSPLILDGILGTGFTPPLHAELAEQMKSIKSQCMGKTIIAVDCPSGVDCKTGSVEQSTLAADLTVCMEGVKTGLMKFPAFEFSGEIDTVDIGILKKIKRNLETEDMVIDTEFVSKILPERKKNSHKGTFGSVLVCGGSVNYPGAPVFTARAAYLAGTGLVKTAVPERIYEVTASQCLTSTWIILDDERGVISETAARVLKSELTATSCLAIGPGMGTEETTFRFFKELLFESNRNENSRGAGFITSPTLQKNDKSSSNSPIVIDADGLRLLAKIPDWSTKTKHNVVLTPHPGEMSVLTGLTVEEIQNDRIEVCRRFAMEWKQVVVLKGALPLWLHREGVWQCAR